MTGSSTILICFYVLHNAKPTRINLICITNDYGFLETLHAIEYGVFHVLRQLVLENESHKSNKTTDFQRKYH